MSDVPDLKDGVFAILRNPENLEEILFARQSYSGGKWSLPGGGLRLGELAPHGVERESLEEVGVRLVGPVRLIGVFTLLKKYGLVLLFEAEAYEGIPKPDNKEIVEVKFFTPEQLDEIPDQVWTAQRSMAHIANKHAHEDIEQPLYGHLTMPPTLIRG